MHDGLFTHELGRVGAASREAQLVSPLWPGRSAASLGSGFHPIERKQCRIAIVLSNPRA